MNIFETIDIRRCIFKQKSLLLKENTHKNKQHVLNELNHYIHNYIPYSNMESFYHYYFGITNTAICGITFGLINKSNINSRKKVKYSCNKTITSYVDQKMIYNTFICTNCIPYNQVYCSS